MVAFVVVVLVLAIVALVIVVERWATPEAENIVSIGYPSYPTNPFSTLPGTRPMSVVLSGNAWRYCKKAHVQGSDTFWKIFEDGPWKWDASGRYAGSGLNPGHYFALSAQGARSEILHYVKHEKELNEYVLLRIEGEVNNVLDLTSVENLYRLKDELGILNNPYDLLGQLVTAATGGNYFTDGLGAYAYDRGYSGILFFSARNIEEYERSHLQSEGYYHEDDELTFKDLVVSEMFENLVNRCLVLFSGAEVVRATKRYYVSGKFENNSYYKMSTEQILQNSRDYGVEYQEQRKLYRGCPDFLRSGPQRCLRCAEREND